MPDTAVAPARAAGPGQPRQHVVALDLMRLLIVAFVVGVHTLTIGGGKVTIALGAFVTVFHTSRELFFLLTAFVLTYNYGGRRVRWPGFWRRRYSLVLPAYLAWSLIYFLADGERLDPVTSAIAAFGHDLLTADARYQLYFLLVTMQVYLSFPLLRWLLSKTAGHHLAVFRAACGYQLALTVAIQQHAVSTGLIGAWLRSPDAVLPSYLLYVIAGGIAAWHFDRFAAFTRRHLTAARLAFAAGLGAGLGAYFAQIAASGQDPAAASAVFQPVVVAESLAFGWALFAVGLMWADAGARHRRLVSTGADSSFGIFLAHPLVLQGALALAGATGVLAVVRRAPAALEVAALLGVAVPLVYGGSGALVFLARRTPLSLALTGRRRPAGPPQSAVARRWPPGPAARLGDAMPERSPSVLMTPAPPVTRRAGPAAGRPAGCGGRASPPSRPAAIGCCWMRAGASNGRPFSPRHFRHHEEEHPCVTCTTRATSPSRPAIWIRLSSSMSTDSESSSRAGTPTGSPLISSATSWSAT